MPGLARRDSLHFAYRLLQDLNVLLVNSVLALERTTRRKAKIIEMAAIVETMPKSKTKSKTKSKRNENQNIIFAQIRPGGPISGHSNRLR